MAAGLMGRALPCGRAYWASWKIAMTQFSSRSTWPAQIHKPKCKNQTKPRRAPAPPPGCSRSWASWTSWTWWCGSWQLRSGSPNTCFCFLGSSNRTSCFDQGWSGTEQKLGLIDWFWFANWINVYLSKFTTYLPVHDFHICRNNIHISLHSILRKKNYVFWHKC